MGETRRHSLDVPITRTLVALRRVRSLRDPCTNSMSKFASLLDTVKWETGSTNGISLQFMNNVEDTEACKLDASMGLIPYESYSIMEELEHGCGLHKVLNAVSVDENNKFGDACTRSSRSPSESMELACNLPLNGEVEDVDSSNFRQRYRSRYSTKLTDSIGDYASRVSSPMTSRTHGYDDDDDDDDEIDDDDQFNRGCGITYCWSRTPRFRGSNQSSDVEEYPLLSRNTNESTLQQRGAGGLGESYEMLRSLSQKFRPKSFDEVIGQEVVVKCLLSTIFRGRITSVYLFHGPRGTGKTSISKIFAAALNCLSQAVHTRPCGLCSECKTGRGKDMMELDSVKLNRSGYLRSLIKSASLPPVSSRFKVFVIDECQLLSEETWGTFLNNLDNVSQHSVFILVTSELEKLPRNVLSRSQKYHFAKVCDLEIANKLVKICMEESIDFDQEAVDFIASKSDGSLRDAEIMLDQLSLVGKRITTSLAYKLVSYTSHSLHIFVQGIMVKRSLSFSVFAIKTFSFQFGL